MMDSSCNPESVATGKSRKVRNDVIFISAILLLLLLVGLAILVFRTAGNTVVVTIDGRNYGEYPLNVDREVLIRSSLGENLLVIEDGKAFVRSASCPDGICSDHRPIGYNGESIICLPNKVVVKIRTRDQAQPDIIT